jgi:hypothetical protein
LGIGEVGGEVDAVDGREVVRQVQALHITVEAFAGDMLGRLEVAGRAAQHFSVGLDAGIDIELRVACQVAETFAPLFFDGVAGQGVKAKTQAQRNQESGPPHRLRWRKKAIKQGYHKTLP